MTIFDMYGDEWTVEAAVDRNGARVVFVGDEKFAPAAARELASAILAAAAALDRPLIALTGGAA